MNSSKFGSFKVYVDGEFLMTVRCYYGDLLDLLWPILYGNPTTDIEIVADVD